MLSCKRQENLSFLRQNSNLIKVTLRLVAQYANISNTFGDPATVAHKMQVLDQWCRTVGRNPNKIERSTSLPTSVSISQFEAYVHVGITHFMVDYRQQNALERSAGA